MQQLNIKTKKTLSLNASSVTRSSSHRLELIIIYWSTTFMPSAICYQAIIWMIDAFKYQDNHLDSLLKITHIAPTWLAINIFKYKWVIIPSSSIKEVTSRIKRYNKYLYFIVRILITNLSLVVFSNGSILEFCCCFQR